MTRISGGWLLGAVALVAATVVACGGEPDQPPSIPAATPTPVATATATASPTATTEATAPPEPTSTATPSPSPAPVPATATPSPSPTPAPTTAPTPAPSDPDATTFRYDTYDTTGAVATAGSYAFLADADGPSWAVTTYEGLRDGTATALLIHTSDADGVSREGVYDAVEVGDLFEWRQADDCFVRYKVTEVKPDPGGTVQRKLLAVEWMIYAFTGCYGRVTPDTSIQFVWDELSELGGESLKVPVTVGIHQLVPDNWTGTVRAAVHEAAPGGSHLIQQANPSTAVLSALDYWREPRVPEGLRLAYVSAGTSNDPYQGFSATYSPTEGGGISLEFSGYFLSHRNRQVPSGSTSSGVVVEARVIAGRPALVQYSPAGDNNYAHIPTTISIMDLATESGYTLTAYDSTLKNIDTLTAIASSLFTEPPTPDATSFRYDTYDTTGAVTAPGSYAFLADSDDPSTVVTTYEALRDGTATALLIHTADADGVSRAGVYDAVEAGDLFEWHKADDCFVRYRVTDLPEADATATRREYGVRWETYVFQGCQTGSVPASATATFTVTAEMSLDHLSGASLTTFAVVHGPWQLAPYTQTSAGAVGNPPAGVAVRSPELTEQPTRFRSPPRYRAGEMVASLTEARRLPYWREPSLPEGWTFSHLFVGGGISRAGYEAVYIAADGYPAVSIRGVHADWRQLPEASSWLTNDSPPRLLVRGLRVIAGRPALVTYSPLGIQHHPTVSTEVRIFDAVTECIYEIEGRDPSLFGGPAALERVIAMAESLFDDGPPTPDGETQ